MCFFVKRPMLPFAKVAMTVIVSRAQRGLFSTIWEESTSLIDIATSQIGSLDQTLVSGTWAHPSWQASRTPFEQQRQRQLVLLISTLGFNWMGTFPSVKRPKVLLTDGTTGAFLLPICHRQLLRNPITAHKGVSAHDQSLRVPLYWTMCE